MLFAASGLDFCDIFQDLGGHSGRASAHPRSLARTPRLPDAPTRDTCSRRVSEDPGQDPSILDTALTREDRASAFRAGRRSHLRRAHGRGLCQTSPVTNPITTTRQGYQGPRRGRSPWAAGTAPPLCSFRPSRLSRPEALDL